MIPIHISIDEERNLVIEGKHLSGMCAYEELGLEIEEDGGIVAISEPINGTTVRMALDNLESIHVIVGKDGVYFLGNFHPGVVVNRVCKSCCGTTACCSGVEIGCGN